MMVKGISRRRLLSISDMKRKMYRMGSTRDNGSIRNTDRLSEGCHTWAGILVFVKG